MFLSDSYFGYKITNPKNRYPVLLFLMVRNQSPKTGKWGCSQKLMVTKFHNLILKLFFKNMTLFFETCFFKTTKLHSK